MNMARKSKKNAPPVAEPKPVEVQEPVATPATQEKHCPECGAVIPRRYRICDPCLAKRQEARKAARKAAKTPPVA
jgi:hypothetical protein